MPRTLLGLPIRSALFDGGILLTMLLLTGVSLLPEADGGRLLVGVLGLGMSAALPFRRRHPTAVGTAVALLALIQAMASKGILPYDVAVLIAAYSVVKYAGRLRDGIAAGLALVAGAALVAVDAQTWADKLAVFAIFVSCCAGTWFAALNSRNRRLYVLSLEDRAATLEREREHLSRIAVGEERNRIARELHDIVAHSLAVMIVQADGGRYVLDTDPGATRAALRAIGDTGRQSLEEMRRLVEVLRDPADPTDPVGEVPVLARLDTLVGRATASGLAVERVDLGEPRTLPSALGLTAYRIVQEALTNALKHAGVGARVTLRLEWLPDRLTITVTDDGAGRLPRPVGSGGHGLVGMRERAALYDGDLVARPRLAGGFEVAATLPLPS